MIYLTMESHKEMFNNHYTYYSRPHSLASNVCTTRRTSSSYVQQTDVHRGTVCSLRVLPGGGPKT